MTKNHEARLSKRKTLAVLAISTLAVLATAFGLSKAYADTKSPEENLETSPLELAFSEEALDLDITNPDQKVIELSPTLVAHEPAVLTDVNFEVGLPPELAIAGDVSVVASDGKNQVLDEEALAENRVKLHFDSLTFTGDEERTDENPIDLSVTVPVSLTTNHNPLLLATAAIDAEELDEPITANETFNVATPIVQPINAQLTSSDMSEDGIKLTTSSSVEVFQDGGNYDMAMALENNSGEDVSDLELKDDVADGVTLTTIDTSALATDSATYGSVTYVTGSNTVKVEKVPQGKSASVTVKLNVPDRSEAAEDPANKGADHPDDLTVKNTASATLKVGSASTKKTLSAENSVTVRKPRLSVTKGQSNIKDDGSATVTVKVRNTAKQTSVANLEVQETLPAGISIVGEPRVCDGYTAQVADNKITITADSSVTLGAEDNDVMSAEYDVKVDSSASNTLKVVTTAKGDNATADYAEQEFNNSDPTLALDVTATPSKVQPGAHVTYVYTLTNMSSKDVTGVVLKDTLPEGITWEESTDATVNGKSLEANIGTVPAGRLVEITAKAVVDEDIDVSTTGELIDKATVTADNATVESKFFTLSVVKPKLDLTKSANKAVVQPGDTVYYTLELVNPEGFPTVTNVVITDPMPDGLILGKDITVSDKENMTYTAEDNVLTVKMPEILGGTTATVVFETTIAENATPGDLENKALFTADDYEGGDSSVDVNGLKPGLNLTHKTDVELAQVGENVPITLTVANGDSGASLKNTQITVELPEEAYVSDVKLPDNATYTSEEHSLNINLGTIPASSDPIDVVYNIVPSVVTEEPLHIKATATATGVEPVESNLDLSVAAPVLSIEKSVDKAEKVVVGDTLNYTITVKNDGDVPAKNAVIEDMLPDGLTLAEVPSPSSESSAGKFAIEETDTGWKAMAEEFAAHSMISFVYSCTVDSIPAEGLKNVAKLSADNVEPLTDTTVVSGFVTKLTLETSAASDSIALGGLNNITAKITNPTEVEITGVKLTSLLPQGLATSETPTVSGDLKADDPEVKTDSWNIANGTIPAGGSAEVGFVVQCNEIPQDTESFTIPVAISADGVPETSAILTLTAAGEASSALKPLSISKQIVEDSAVAGGTLNYVITVSNSAAAPSVPQFQIRDTLPTGMNWASNVTIDISGGTSTTQDQPTSQDLVLDVPGLQPGQAVTIKYMVRIADSISDGTALVNTASITDTAGNVVLSANATVNISGQQQMLASKMADTGIPALGGGFGLVGIATLATYLLRRRSH